VIECGYEYVCKVRCKVQGKMRDVERTESCLEHGRYLILFKAPCHGAVPAFGG